MGRRASLDSSRARWPSRAVANRSRRGNHERVERPETRFAWNEDVALAYQTLGDGPVDLLYLQGYASNIELNWDHPVMTRFLHGLAHGRRLIMTDGRGMGASERFTPSQVWPLETGIEDLTMVLGACGSDRTAILADNE